MSRSFRHTPVIGNACAASDKPGKQIANRTLRMHVRICLLKALRNSDDFDNLVVPLLREVSNVWSFPKDGKHRMNPNGSYYRKCMRK
ncbi:hypothetical protein KBI23_26185 [bacterium]|nr:hypothetical protein [bacterium]